MKLYRSIHLCITYLHTLEGVADRFLDDMRETVAEIMKNPKDDDAGSVFEMESLSSLSYMSALNNLFFYPFRPPFMAWLRVFRIVR